MSTPLATFVARVITRQRLYYKLGVYIMNVREAVAARTEQLLRERAMSRHQLAKNMAVGDGLLYNIIRGKNRRSVDFNTVCAIADGFDMNVIEFLNVPLFYNDNLDLN